jgi:hypothetical protein
MPSKLWPHDSDIQHRRSSVRHLPSPGPEWVRSPAPRHGDGARNGAAACFNCSDPSHAAIGRRQVSCGLVTRTLNTGDRQYGTYRPRALNGCGVPRPGTGTAPETGRPPVRLTVWTTPDPGPPEPLLSCSTLTPARGRRVLHQCQVRPAAGPLGARPNTALSPLGSGGGLPRTWPAGPRPRRPRQARQSISQSHPGVVTCTAAARSAGPRPVRGPPTGQAQRHAQDTTAPAPPPTL